MTETFQSLNLTNLETLKQYFAGNPNGYLIGNADLWHNDERGRRLGVATKQIVLFQVERNERRTDMQEYVNVFGYCHGEIVGCAFELDGQVTAGSANVDWERNVTYHTIKLDSLVEADPATADMIQILRWRKKIFAETGAQTVNITDTFQLAKNAASAEFFTSLFSGASVPSKAKLEEGIRILNEQISGLRPEQESPLEVGDTVTFTADFVERSARVVELFPDDSVAALLLPNGAVTSLPYAELTKER